MKANTHTAQSRFQIDCLAVISGLETRDESPYGLAIKRGLEDLYGDEITIGRLYTNLDGLVRNDCLEKNALDGRTNTYSLTNEGMGVLRDRIGGLQDTMDGKQAVEA